MQIREMGKEIGTKKSGLGVDSQANIFVGEFHWDLCPHPSSVPKRYPYDATSPKNSYGRVLGAMLELLSRTLHGRCQVPQLDSKKP